MFAGVRRSDDGEALRSQAPENPTPLIVDVTERSTISAAVEVTFLFVAFLLMILLWREGIPYREMAISMGFLGVGVGLAGTPSSTSLTGSVPSYLTQTPVRAVVPTYGPHDLRWASGPSGFDRTSSQPNDASEGAARLTWASSTTTIS